MSELHPEIVELEPQEALVLHGEVPMTELTEFFGRAFSEVPVAAAAAGLEIVGPPFGYYLGMPTDTVTLAAGFPVRGEGPAEGEFRRLVLPGGRAVRVMHVGPYDTMRQTYDALFAWMLERGLEPSDGMWESYLSDPDEHPDPATWQTLIVWPLRS